jgi:hypothetical protein
MPKYTHVYNSIPNLVFYFLSLIEFKCPQEKVRDKSLQTKENTPLEALPINPKPLRESETAERKDQANQPSLPQLSSQWLSTTRGWTFTRWL